MILGRFVDAVATDLFTGGNRYARQEALYYFDGPMPDNDKLVIKAEETNYLFDVERKDETCSQKRIGCYLCRF